MSSDFKPVPGWSGQYEITRGGIVRSCAHERTHWRGGVRRYAPTILRQESHKAGYARVVLCRGSQRRRAFVHALVLETFVGPRPRGAVACHINGNPRDNRVENLRWGSHQDNTNDKRRHGRVLVGTRHPMAKLTTDQLAAIDRWRALGHTSAQIATAVGVTEGHIRKLKQIATRNQPTRKD